LAAVKQLGKKCSKCGYDKNSAALQFHHIDPKTKSFNFGNVANKSWKSISSELDKCILLCANCHAIEHSTRDNELFIKWVASYQGKKLDF
jgi:predicted HNH restriction endonuclease